MKRTGTILVLSASIFIFLTTQACAMTTRLFSGSEPTPRAAPPTLPPAGAGQPTQPAPVVETAAAPTTVPAPTVTASREFSLSFYRPLVMDYDPALWLDKTQYGDPNEHQTNLLQSTSLESCRISIQGPTEYPNLPHQEVQLGQVKYIMFVMENQSGENLAWYVENNSLTGYSYDPGLPIPVISASTAEWEQCRQMGEPVLATLHVP